MVTSRQAAHGLLFIVASIVTPETLARHGCHIQPLGERDVAPMTVKGLQTGAQKWSDLPSSHILPMLNCILERRFGEAKHQNALAHGVTASM